MARLYLFKIVSLFPPYACIRCSIHTEIRRKFIPENKNHQMNVKNGDNQTERTHQTEKKEREKYNFIRVTVVQWSLHHTIVEIKHPLANISIIFVDSVWRCCYRFFYSPSSFRACVCALKAHTAFCNYYYYYAVNILACTVDDDSSPF